jgi:hypothetical protein
MKPTIKSLFAFSLLVLILASCSKKPATILIPGNAAMVFHINAASLGSKLSWNEIKNSDWFKMATKRGADMEDEFSKKLLDDPENSGIDLKSDMYFFVQPHGNGAYIVFEGKLKDPTVFETSIKKITGDIQIAKEGSLNFIANREACLSWNKERFIVTGNIEDFMGRRRNMFDESPRKKMSSDSILAFTKGIYSLKKNESMDDDSRFSSLMNEKGDMHFWMNTGLFFKSSMPMGMGDMFKATSLMEGNVTGYTLSFDNGKIISTSKSWYNKELGAFMQKYKAGNINTDMLKRISGQNVSAVIAMNYPPEGLKEFLKLLGMDGMANGFLDKAGFSLDEFIKANKGDLLLAVSDFSVQDKTVSFDFGGSEPMTYTKSKPDAKILFATSINDKPSFDKLVDIIKSKISEKGDSETTDKIKYAIKDSWFIASNSQESIDGFAAGNKTEHDFISKISGHPMGMYIDLQKMLGGIQTKDAEGFKSILTGEGKMWDNIVFYGGEMNDGVATGHMEINMIDKNTNSLKQLNNFITALAKIAKQKKENDMSERDFPKLKDEEVNLPPPAQDSLKAFH